ncbi:MAG: amidohydrolase family protein [Caldilineaceae bacterium]
MDTFDWILRNGRLDDQAPLTDLAIHAGKIARIAPALAGMGSNEWELNGCVIMPGMVDLHTHLDKTYFNIANQSGTLLEAIMVWRANKHHDMRNRIRAGMSRALKQAIRYGTTAIRTHVDIELQSDLVALETVLEVREQFKEQIDLQIVALGGLTRTHEADAAVASALDMGAEFVGGAPALEENPEAALLAVFKEAERTGKPIDLHIDETEDPAMRTLERLADLTIAHGLQGQVTAGHCCSLAFMQPTDAQRIIDKVAKAQITIISLPSCNLVLMGRSHFPAPRGVTRIKELRAAGVNVCAASDNVCDPFNPLGNYDLLQIANLTAHVAHMSGSEEIAACLQMVSSNPAKTFYGNREGIVEGAKADLVILDTQCIAEMVPQLPTRLGTFKDGKLVVTIGP